MNVFTSDLFPPVMSDGLSTVAPRDFRTVRFGRRYGRASRPSTQAVIEPLPTCVIEAIGDECVRLDFDLAA